jgi:hypothetical protein
VGQHLDNNYQDNVVYQVDLWGELDGLTIQIVRLSVVQDRKTVKQLYAKDIDDNSGYN